MFQLSEYMQFGDADLEEVAFYNEVKKNMNDIRQFANGERFDCLINDEHWRFLHATLGENSWYEIYKLNIEG